jgi:hypothetical protein
MHRRPTIRGAGSAGDHHAVMRIVPVIVAAYGGMIGAALAAAPRRSA